MLGLPAIGLFGRGFHFRAVGGDVWPCACVATFSWLGWPGRPQFNGCRLVRYLQTPRPQPGKWQVSDHSGAVSRDGAASVWAGRSRCELTLWPLPWSIPSPAFGPVCAGLAPRRQCGCRGTSSTSSGRLRGTGEPSPPCVDARCGKSWLDPCHHLLCYVAVSSTICIRIRNTDTKYERIRYGPRRCDVRTGEHRC